MKLKYPVSRNEVFLKWELAMTVVLMIGCLLFGGRS